MLSNGIVTIIYEDNGQNKAVTLFAENITYDNSNEQNVIADQRVISGKPEDNSTIDFITRPIGEANDPNKMKNLFYKLAGAGQVKSPYFSLKLDWVVDSPNGEVKMSRRWQSCVLRKDIGISNFTLGERLSLEWSVSGKEQGEWI